ncbi:adenosylcobinamide-phosphate synthase CbiB [Pseudochelatococcus lubricantis]|uniref:adenosylcobinamide-phosphate synthase CbiB n=1 Tax=Pseudochelatococcus lubricantis TaxID=1538102 RepID=UPI0035EDB24A
MQVSLFILAFLSLAIEAAAGYPDRLYRAIGHPVTWIGALISLLDRHLNRDGAAPGIRKAAGVAALLALIAVSGAAGFTVQRLCGDGVGLLVTALAASTLLAQRSLHGHVAAVADALDREGLAGGRRAVAHIVGRDPESLDEAAVARAAIESLAENFSDGVIAPAFWLAAAGLPGAAVYKAINTADSMIGHRTPRHGAFGWASARLDDLVNLPASRLTALLLVAAAALSPGASARDAWRAVLRDARHHRSPNAGWPEAAMAGALGVSLAGPRHYGGVRVEDARMNAGGRQHATAGDIRRALALYRLADALFVATLALAAALLMLHG